MSAVAESAIRWALMQSTDLTALVADRIEPRINAQNSKTPRIAILRPPGQENPNHFQGSIGVSRTPIIVACISDDYDQSRAIGGLVEEILDPTGSRWAGSKFWNGTEIGSCIEDESFDHSALPQLADEIGVPVEFVTFTLEHASS